MSWLLPLFGRRLTGHGFTCCPQGVGTLHNFFGNWSSISIAEVCGFLWWILLSMSLSLTFSGIYFNFFVTKYLLSPVTEKNYLPNMSVIQDMKIINIYVNLPLSCMQIGQIPAIQMTNVIRCTVLAIQFMCNHRRNVTFLNQCGKCSLLLQQQAPGYGSPLLRKCFSCEIQHDCLSISSLVQQQCHYSVIQSSIRINIKA